MASHTEATSQKLRKWLPAIQASMSRTAEMNGNVSLF